MLCSAHRSLCVALLLLSLAREAASQKVGTNVKEEHPPLLVYECTLEAGCEAKQRSVVIDANWRWVHEAGEGKYANCYDGTAWSKTLCPDVASCAANCAVEGISAQKGYKETYGVSTSGASLNLKLVMPGNVGSRLYLLEDEETYQLFQLNNREFSFEVDASATPCGVNGALYFVQMDADGGKAKYATNEAGAKYGTGYCDAQCPHDAKFINGEPNILDWAPIPQAPDSARGRYGSCCVEMDVWEANSLATAYTAHSCAVHSQTRCDGAACGDDWKGQRYDGVCDKDGCDVQPYRLGNRSFYGPSAAAAIDSTRPFTVVTQFVTADGTDGGALSQIRRHYWQDGVRVDAAAVEVGGGRYDGISAEYCAAEAAAFGGNGTFAARGGMGSMGAANDAGMVLVLSLWDDPLSHMLWLDSTQPANSTKPGATRGPCALNSGDPKVIERSSRWEVTYSNIKFGEIGSTDKPFPPSPPSPPAPPPSPPPPLCAKGWTQCGGKTYRGPTCCEEGFHCVANNPYFSECSPNGQPSAAAVGQSTPRAAPSLARGGEARAFEPVFATFTRHSKVAINVE
ncbi:hypothetical protein AB1Y20_005946 [Prymnesium parvum]|uniref:cellulase n=1 Tax=Prymnesium parvum TaxID=97485 RepID=A0AB34J1U4_PRYPA